MPLRQPYMDFRLSNHAQTAMIEEKIPYLVIQSAMSAPEQVVEEDGLKVYQLRIDRSGETQLLRVYVNDKVSPVVIVTVYATSKISKYWRPE